MTEQELLVKAKKLEGKKLGEISDRINRLSEADLRKFNKSVVGNIIETDYFNIPTNSSEDGDFKCLGLDIELKVSPLKLVRGNIMTTKERNVLKMVDYFDIKQNSSWKDSKLGKKFKSILFVMYHHDNEVHPKNWTIVTAFIWHLNDYYEPMIARDYAIIRQNVLAGVVLSERHTSFLATCPKHGGGYVKSNPSLSVESALAAHPVISHAEKRGYCIKQAEFTKLICRETGKPLITSGRTIGFAKN